MILLYKIYIIGRMIWAYTMLCMMAGWLDAASTRIGWPVLVV